MVLSKNGAPPPPRPWVQSNANPVPRRSRRTHGRSRGRSCLGTEVGTGEGLSNARPARDFGFQNRVFFGSESSECKEPPLLLVVAKLGSCAARARRCAPPRPTPPPPATKEKTRTRPRTRTRKERKTLLLAKHPPSFIIRPGRIYHHLSTALFPTAVLSSGNNQALCHWVKTLQGDMRETAVSHTTSRLFAGDRRAIMLRSFRSSPNAIVLASPCGSFRYSAAAREEKSVTNVCHKNKKQQQGY